MSAARNSHRRRRNRGRFGLLFKVLAAATMLMALTMGATVFFQLEHVEVEGYQRYTPQQVEAASGLQAGDNLFHLNKNRISADIRQKLPYVEELSIMRRLPSTILIRVKECEAVAQVVPTPLPEPEKLPAEEKDEKNQTDKKDEMSGAEEKGEPEKKDEKKPSLTPAEEKWLISRDGKLLEPAPEGSTAIEVNGLSALSPRAGDHLAVPQEQQGKLDTLIVLLHALDDRGMTKMISQIDLSSAAHIQMRYDQRFWVKLPMGGDFPYLLRALETILPDWQDREGGTFDLTRDRFTFSPG